ncbi:hypothetical protein [Bradyrhizobium sp. CCBAU 45389]|uniref:hypothetical protein n=1 Tax=Bradyrhizobium sp. CCBAU 45389 TaxID=858429 RepID=UPI002305395A|nr:hypothetical protein [Bradyrhizobium sp. CCBAU 45389]MDA9399832.1 hypothetical protein [Bradyrhizobium sp. CCBAU 45389]
MTGERDDNMAPSCDERKPDINPDDCVPFTWDDPCVIVEPVAATAVYIDGNDNVVIRQQGAWNEEGDHLIILPRHEAEKLAGAIFDATVALWPSNRQRQGEAEKAAPTAAADIRRDRTAAARMRRFRERQRNGEPDRNGDRNADRNSERNTDRNADPTLRAEAAE